MSLIVFSVPGTPVAQGSMVIMQGKIRHQRSERLETWRANVAHECREAMRSGKNPIYSPIEGPISVELSFIYKGKKADEGYPKTTAPDLDKLTRAVLDALTGVLYVDDRQVTHIDANKRWSEDPIEDRPGLVVNAWTESLS